MTKKGSKRRPRVSIVRSQRAGNNEAEQIVQAIRGGRIDALVMESARGDRVVNNKGYDITYSVVVV
jgi:hypothetical protein